MKALSYTPGFAALTLAVATSTARAEAISQSKVTLSLTLSQTAPSLTPRNGTGTTQAGARVYNNQYTDRRGNTITEVGSAMVRTRFGNRELLTSLKTLGVIPDIAGYFVVRENNTDTSGTYYLHKKLPGGQFQRIAISQYMVDSLPLLKHPVSSESGRNQANAAGAQTSFTHQISSAGVGGVEFRGIFPAVAGDGSTGAMVLEGPASLKETYVTGKGYVFNAGFPTLSGGYTRILRASGEAPGREDHVYAEGSLNIAPSTFITSPQSVSTPGTGTLVGNATVSLGSGAAGSFAGSVFIPGNTPGTISSGGLIGSGAGSVLTVTDQGELSTVNLNAANLANTAGIIKNGSGTLVLQDTNTYTGNISVFAGSLVLQNASSYAGSITYSGGTLNPASLAIPAGGGLILNGNTGTYTITDAAGTRLSQVAQ